MGWLDSDAIAMYPSQGRSDYYNRKARYVSEANVTVSAGALTSKHGFVINGLVPSKVDVGSQLSAGSFWIRGYVFTVTRNISISETGSNAGDVLCAVLRTDENGQRVGIADRIINQYDNSTYELDAKDGSAFYGIQIVTKTQAEWNNLTPQHEECRYEIVSGTSGNNTKFYLRLALWNNGAWEQPKNENVALNGLKIDASAISVTMAKTQSDAAKQDDYAATQDLATLLNKNFIVDDGATGENGHIRIRELELTTSNLSTEIVDRQPVIVRKSNATYLFVGDGTSTEDGTSTLRAMQPITVRTVEGWTADEGGLTETETETETKHYKISGSRNDGLKLECGNASIVLDDTIKASSLSVTGTTTLTGLLTANGGITASDLTVKGKTETDSLSVTGTGGLSVDGTTTLTKELTANGGITASDLTVKGKTETDSLSVTGADGLSVTGTTTLTGKLTANGGITATGLTASGEVTGKIGEITGVTEWKSIVKDDTIAGGFAKTNYAISDLRDRMKSAEDKLNTLDSQSITGKSDFGGTGEAVTSIKDLVDVLDSIFRGNCTVLGMIKSANGFYATGGV